MKLLILALMAASTALQAQGLPLATDSAIARARALVQSGDSIGAKRVLDSVATHGNSALSRSEARFQLIRLTTSATIREDLLGAFVVDHPFSPRLGDALRELGTLALTRNDRERAIMHLARYLSVSPPSDTARVATSLVLGRLHFERGELPRGCSVLLVGRSELPETAIELRNQFDFSIGRCQNVDTTRKADARGAVDSTPAPRRTGAFTVQVAAYDTKSAAEKLATSLRALNLEARVVGISKPFRVRVGRYATRAEAEEASRDLNRTAKTQSMVVIVGPEER
jgi:hypothetical protein